MVNLSNINGFDWDDFNRDKNWQKHGVLWVECEEVFFNEPVLLYFDDKHSNEESRFYALGRTDNKRDLFIVFTLRNDKIRVISARDMNKKEKSQYEKYSKI
ncbi:MAG: BrnT family toxin [Candidatus Kapabacteria bacterium]|nr:BrnT family toxin [Candidatus Kapabacteria bacterium]